MWDLPRPGLEPVSPALAGRFSTTVPPGKPSAVILDVASTGRFELVGCGWALQCGCSSSNMPMKVQPKLPDVLCSKPNVTCIMEFLCVPKNHYAF